MEMGNFVDFVERYNLEGNCAKGIKLSPKFDGDGMNIKVQNKHNHTHTLVLSSIRRYHTQYWWLRTYVIPSFHSFPIDFIHPHHLIIMSVKCIISAKKQQIKLKSDDPNGSNQLILYHNNKIYKIHVHNSYHRTIVRFLFAIPANK